jgi:hypothetical protein
MEKCEIIKDDVVGYIEYYFDGRIVKWSVHHPDGSIKADLAEYFSTPREYRIPESQQIDDYRIDTALPTDNITYFELSLCTMWSSTSVSLLTNGDRDRLNLKK